jgi:hypothetical protein
MLPLPDNRKQRTENSRKNNEISSLKILAPPLNQKRQKTTTKQSGRAPRVEPERRTARGSERCFKVVFKFWIFKQ